MKHMGETTKSDRYTSKWSNSEESDSFSSYFVNQFIEVTKTNSGFLEPILEVESLEEGVPSPTLERNQMIE